MSDPFIRNPQLEGDAFFKPGENVGRDIDNPLSKFGWHR